MREKKRGEEGRKGKGEEGREEEGEEGREGNHSTPSSPQAYSPNLTHVFRNKLSSTNSSFLLGHNVQILEKWIIFFCCKCSTIGNLLVFKVS